MPLSPLNFSSDISEALGQHNISGSDMAANLPSDFNDFAERAYKAVEQPDVMQIPNNWGSLIGGLPLLSDDYYYLLSV